MKNRKVAIPGAVQFWLPMMANWYPAFVSDIFSIVGLIFFKVGWSSLWQKGDWNIIETCWPCSRTHELCCFLKTARKAQGIVATCIETANVASVFEREIRGRGIHSKWDACVWDFLHFPLWLYDPFMPVILRISDFTAAILRVCEHSFTSEWDDWTVGGNFVSKKPPKAKGELPEVVAVVDWNFCNASRDLEPIHDDAEKIHTAFLAWSSAVERLSFTCLSSSNSCSCLTWEDVVKI